MIMLLIRNRRGRKTGERFHSAIARPRETREEKKKREEEEEEEELEEEDEEDEEGGFSPIYFGNHKQVVPKSVIGNFSAIVPGSFTAGNTV